MIQLIRGFKDILPGEAQLWQYVEKTAQRLFEQFGYREIRIPIMERTQLFARSIGEDTDIVEKEMYTFSDRGGEMITLRPEATASIVRAYIQHKLYAPDPVQKLYTIGPMFRRERPQKGRYRQFYQIDVEVLGVASAYVDAELIFLLVTLFDRLNVTDLTARINSLGCPACRPDFRVALIEFLAGKQAELCADCNRRKERNPLRVLDCKVPGCRQAVAGAPSLVDFLCGECREHFSDLKDGLGRLDVPYVVDHRLVRGLDYYTRTTFEIQTGSLGAQNAIAGGGRYDNLIELLGGPSLPATGFAIGFDRLVEVSGLNPDAFSPQLQVFVAALGARCRRRAFAWVNRLGLMGILADMEYADRSLKSQMKRAHRRQAAHVLIVGEDELAAGKAPLRNMTTKEQTIVSLDGLVDQVARIVDTP